LSRNTSEQQNKPTNAKPIDNRIVDMQDTILKLKEALKSSYEANKTLLEEERAEITDMKREHDDFFRFCKDHVNRSHKVYLRCLMEKYRFLIFEECMVDKRYYLDENDLRRGMCRFPQKEISEISEISVIDNNSHGYRY
jgi:hypothetical protein